MDDLHEHAGSMADVVLRQAGVDGDDRPDPWEVARALGIRLFKAPRSARWSALGEHIHFRGEDRVYVRTGLTERFERTVVAHEIGHVVARRFDLQLEAAEEPWCNAFGAALLTPAAAVWRAWRACQDVGTMIDLWPEVSPTLVAMRAGECRCADVWVMQARRVLYARAAATLPGDALEVAKLALAEGRVRRGPLSAGRLPEQRGRAFIAAAA